MKQWKSNLFTIAGVIVVGYILFIMAEVMDASEMILGKAMYPYMFLLVAAVCLLLGITERQMQPWRKWCWMIGMIFAVIYALYFMANGAELLSLLFQFNISIIDTIASTLSILLPTLFAFIPAVCLTIYTVSRPSRWKIPVLNIFATLAVLVVCGWSALFFGSYFAGACGF